MRISVLYAVLNHTLKIETKLFQEEIIYTHLDSTVQLEHEENPSRTIIKAALNKVFHPIFLASICHTKVVKRMGGGAVPTISLVTTANKVYRSIQSKKTAAYALVNFY